MRWEQLGPEAHKASVLLPKGWRGHSEAISSFTLWPNMMALIDEQQEMVQGKHKTVLQQESKQRTLHQHQYSTFSILRQTVELNHGFLFQTNRWWPLWLWPSSSSYLKRWKIKVNPNTGCEWMTKQQQLVRCLLLKQNGGKLRQRWVMLQFLSCDLILEKYITQSQSVV